MQSHLRSVPEETTSTENIIFAISRLLYRELFVFRFFFFFFHQWRDVYQFYVRPWSIIFILAQFVLCDFRRPPRIFFGFKLPVC